jgi:hypothetical protein
MEDDHAHHVSTVRSAVTQNLGTCYNDIRDEIVTAFEDVLGVQGNGILRHPYKQHVMVYDFDRMDTHSGNGSRLTNSLPCRQPILCWTSSMSVS